MVLGAAVEYKLDVLGQLRAPVQPVLPETFSQDALNTRSGTVKEGIYTPLPSQRDGRARWREDLRQTLRRRIGDVAPVTEAPVFEQVSRSEANGVEVFDLIAVARDGQKIPARVFAPTGESVRPGVIVVPGHVSPGESGLEQLSGGESYHHAAAAQLAAAGYMVITFELRGMGYLGPPRFPEHRAVAFNALKSGGSYKRLVLQDVELMSRVLRQFDGVDADRVGIAGASFGGEIAVQYAALDERIDAISFHSFGGRVGVVPDLAAGARQPHYCHILPSVDDWLPREAWIWLLAPRPVQGVRGLNNETGFLTRQRTYARGWEQPELMQLETVPGGHEFFVEKAIAFFDMHLAAGV